jgi:hypothetical protein
VIVEKILAAVILGVCLLLGLRMGLSAPRQQRFDAQLRRLGLACKRLGLRVYHWRSSRRVAARETEAAIRRARHAGKKGEEGEWQGNVYTPKSFSKKPRKPH